MMPSINIQKMTIAGTMVMLALSGCQTAKQVTGSQFVHFSASPDRVVKAANGALEHLELRVVSSSATKLDGKLEAETAQGKTVTIIVNREDEGVSKVEIKVGALGDESISQAIIDETRKRLDD